MIYSSCNIYQRTFRKGLFITQYIYAANIPKGVGTDSSRPHHQQKQLIVICKILRIAMQTMGKRNTISGNFVDTGTINRPLRLRGERGKTHSPFKKHYQIENEKYTQRTLHKGYSLRNIYAANTPQGVGADSSCPFFNPNQMVLMYRNDANCNAILWNYAGVVQ